MKPSSAEMEMLAVKDYRLDSVTPKTFEDGELPRLKSVFAWVKSNRKIPVNPISGLLVKQGKRIVVRSNWFTDGLDDRFGLLADWILVRHQIHLPPQLKQAFLRQVAQASIDAG